jgi:transcriptional regulator with XRE-family HTH domain
MKIVPAMPEISMLEELGARAQQYRVGLNRTQAELATDAGVSQRTIERFEAGSSVQLDKLLRILRAMKLTENLDQLIPETSIRPIQLAGARAETRKRSYKKRDALPATSGWVWGDRK